MGMVDTSFPSEVNILLALANGIVNPPVPIDKLAVHLSSMNDDSFRVSGSSSTFSSISIAPDCLPVRKITRTDLDTLPP